MTNEAIHHAIISIDVQGSGNLTNPAKLAMRECLYSAVTAADHQAGVAADRQEDRGDGLLAAYAATTPKARLLGPWLATLDRELRCANAGSSAEPVRVRVGVHAGEVHFDDFGMSGADVDLACRLADAAIAKQALASANAGYVAVVVSELIFRSVIAHGGPYIRGSHYARVPIRVKEVDTDGWLAVLGYTVAPVPRAAKVDEPQAERGGRRPGGRRARGSDRLVVNADNAGVVQGSSVESIHIGNSHHRTLDDRP